MKALEEYILMVTAFFFFFTAEETSYSRIKKGFGKKARQWKANETPEIRGTKAFHDYLG